MANGRRRLSRSAVSTAPHVDGVFHVHTSFVCVGDCGGHMPSASVGVVVFAVSCAGFGGLVVWQDFVVLPVVWWRFENSGDACPDGLLL